MTVYLPSAHGMENRREEGVHVKADIALQSVTGSHPSQWQADTQGAAPFGPRRHDVRRAEELQAKFSALKIIVDYRVLENHDEWKQDIRCQISAATAASLTKIAVVEIRTLRGDNRKALTGLNGTSKKGKERKDEVVSFECGHWLAFWRLKEKWQPALVSCPKN